VVSEQGPVTVLRAGQIIGRSPVVAGVVEGDTAPVAAEGTLHNADHRAS